ncbi:MAG: diguanylate cyclase [Candidatus Omnitrophota bacterium]
MKKILYCVDKSHKRKPFFPFSFVVTSKIKDSYKKDFSVIIFEENFLKKREELDFSRFPNKICLIYFLKKSEDSLKLVKKCGFFGYITSEDSQPHILFKLNQVEKLLEFKEQGSILQKKLLAKDRKIERIALVDSLTGCHNWRYFLHRVPQELSRARRHFYDLSFIIIDIDYFRQINEIYNVKIADAVIKELVGILKKNLRKEDILTRWREDEFFIILPHLSRECACRVAEKLIDKIALHKFKYRNLSLHIKVSAGLVSFPKDGTFNTKDTINALDECLIIAKREGGNKIVPYFRSKPDIIQEKKKKANVNELRNKIERLNSLLNRDFLEMVYGFARAIEAKDHYTGKHVEYTVAIAENIAKELHLSPLEIENIKHAAILHDLGKVGIDEDILSKNGPLTPKERKIIETHPSIAAEILREIHALSGAIPAILYHHERYDGKGYPLGLKGEEIPLGARIVAIADVYQALVSDRPYRKAYSKKKAIEIIKKETGDHFDSKIVKVFLEVIRKTR